MVNIELHDECKTLVKELLCYIKQEELKGHIERNQYWNIPYIKDLEGFSTFTKARKIIAQMDNLSISSRDDLAKFTLNSFLSRFLSGDHNLDYEDKLFEKMYNDLETYLCADSLKYRALMPLNNFSCDEDIRTSDGIVVRKYTEEDHTKLQKELGIEERYLTKHILEFNYTIGKEKTVLSVDYIPEKELNKFISALRLYKSGDLIASMLITEPLMWNPRGFRYPKRIYYKNPGGQDNQYVMTKDEIPRLIDFWNFYNKDIEKKEYKRLDTAIRRFNLLYQRGDVSDEIIDLMIAFESLFLEDNEGELKYRLSIYVANFLGEDRNQRKQYHNVIKEAYKLRSSIIHGGLVLNEQEVIKDSIYNLKFDHDKSRIIEENKKVRKNTEDLLRKSILKFIQEIKGGKNYEAIIEEIKDSVF